MDTHRQSLIPIFITDQLERAANRALQYAPITRMRLVGLKGQSFALELQRPHIPLLIQVDRRHVRFQSRWEQTADVTVRGPFFAVLRQLAAEDQTPAGLMRNGIEIEGDQELAQRFMTLLKELDLDLESILGDLIGDLAAHSISEVARTGFGWLKRAAGAALDQGRQLMQEDNNLIVSRAEFSHFQKRIEALTEDTERLQARTQRLQRQLQDQEEVKP